MAPMREPFRITSATLIAMGTIALALPALAAEQAEPGARAEAPAGEPAKGALSEEERDQVRRIFREQDLERFGQGETVNPDDTGGAESDVIIGKPFPTALKVRPIPERVLDKLPKRPGYEYRLFGNNVALVDTRTNEITDVVREIYTKDDKDKG